jgi:sec-independent protein translocase protein TatB
MVLALVVFGPRRLPQIARQMGKLMYEFRKASNDFKFQMEEELRAAEDADRRKAEEQRLRALALAAPAPTAVDSQVSEADSGTAASAGPTSNGGSALAVRAAAETTSWEESAYPPAIAPPAEAPGEETYPRIQPPSTGEQVPAAKPWSLEEELAKVSGAAADPEGSLGAGTEANAGAAEATNEGQPDEAAPATEPTRHG